MKQIFIVATVLGLMVPLSASAQEDPRFPGARFPGCEGLTGGELSTCIMEGIESETNELVSNITDGQEQSSEPVGTPVTSNETINAGIYVNSTRYEYLNELLGRMDDHWAQIIPLV